MDEMPLPLKDDVNEAAPRADETYQQLVTEHQALDERIRQLSSLAYLTDQQRYEETSLKKKKLALKDRIEAIMRSQRLAAIPRH